MAKSLATTAEW
jgi:hypothetical protein